MFVWYTARLLGLASAGGILALLVGSGVFPIPLAVPYFPLPLAVLRSHIFLFLWRSGGPIFSYPSGGLAVPYWGFIYDLIYYYYYKNIFLINGLQIHVIKAPRWRITCAVLIIISAYFHIILN